MGRLRFGHLILLTSTLAAAAANSAQADTFYSGRVDVSPAFGGTVITGVKRFSGFSGQSYTNLDPSTGTVTALGFAQFSTSHAGNFSGIPADPSQRLVAVFALQGKSTSTLTQLSADFDPITGSTVSFPAMGQLRIYDFINAPTIDVTDPGTWVPNINDLSQGLVAVFNTVSRPDAVLQGPPGSPNTEPVLGFDPTKVNTARTVFGTAGAEGDATLKFVQIDQQNPGNPVIDPTSTLLDFTPPGYLVNPNSPDLLVDIDELLQPYTASDLTDLQTIFGGFLGGQVFVKSGDTFDPTQFGANGDTSQSISGGDAFPGSQQVIPEPSSVLAFTLLLGGGLGARLIRRRQVKA